MYNAGAHCRLLLCPAIYKIGAPHQKGEYPMNVRKPTDYSIMFAALDELMAASMSQMDLYRGIGRVVSGRPEKGAAVAAAEYLQSTYPSHRVLAQKPAADEGLLPCL